MLTNKTYWIVTSSYDRFAKHGWNLKDGYDKLRDSVYTHSSVMTSPLEMCGLLRAIGAYDIVVDRSIPKSATEHLKNSGSGYNCPCWFIFCKFKENGEEYNAAYRITTFQLPKKVRREERLDYLLEGKEE